MINALEQRTLIADKRPDDTSIHRDAMIFTDFDEGVEELARWVHREYEEPTALERAYQSLQRFSRSVRNMFR